MLQAYVGNQGDGWTYVLEYLRRHLEEHRTAPATDELPVEVHEAFLMLMRTLAQRTAELHGALASASDNQDFAPQPLTRTDFESYRDRAVRELRATFELLKSNLEQIPGPDRAKADQVLALQDKLLAAFEAAIGQESGGRKIRIHGDYHLGQVLLTRNDFVIVDFEGEPGHAIEECRLA